MTILTVDVAVVATLALLVAVVMTAELKIDVKPSILVVMDPGAIELAIDEMVAVLDKGVEAVELTIDEMVVVLDKGVVEVELVIAEWVVVLDIGIVEVEVTIDEKLAVLSMSILSKMTIKFSRNYDR